MSISYGIRCGGGIYVGEGREGKSACLGVQSRLAFAFDISGIVRRSPAVRGVEDQSTWEEGGKERGIAWECSRFDVCFCLG